MNFRRPIILLLIITAAGFSSGCRSGVSAHGRTLSWLLVPMYKQPLGFSSTYQQHLAQMPTFVEQASAEVECKNCEPDTRKTGETSTPPRSDDKVVFPEQAGPTCKLPIPNRSAKRFELIRPR